MHIMICTPGRSGGFKDPGNYSLQRALRSDLNDVPDEPDVIKTLDINHIRRFLLMEKDIDSHQNCSVLLYD